MAHIHEKIDFTASVYVVFNGKVALHLHKKLGIWLPPGGHIELDEDPNIAALREVKEEIGLDIELVGNEPLPAGDDPTEQELIPPKFLNRHNFNATHEHIDLVYFGRATTDVVVPEEPGAKVRWFSKEEIEQDEAIRPRICAYALAALDALA